MKTLSRIETGAVLTVALVSWMVAISAAREMIEAHGLSAILLG